MAKITKEQLNKWNDQAKNGFQFDLKYFLIWNEKTLTKKIKMENGDIVEFKLEYEKESKTITNSYGCSWNVKTGRYIPMLYIIHWRPTDYSSYHSIFDEKEIFGNPEESKKYGTLCKLSSLVNTDKYMMKYKEQTKGV